ncbi:hypothetical protein QE152_g33155 [Popillia japonica]|uniref:Uncharacterized protein n=1 Tax=Popillia japonica TaxID=7064 RepID=A0AAW1IY65_POPJA
MGFGGFMSSKKLLRCTIDWKHFSTAMAAVMKRKLELSWRRGKQRLDWIGKERTDEEEAGTELAKREAALIGLARRELLLSQLEYSFELVLKED